MFLFVSIFLISIFLLSRQSKNRVSKNIRIRLMLLFKKKIIIYIIWFSWGSFNIAISPSRSPWLQIIYLSIRDIISRAETYFAEYFTRIARTWNCCLSRYIPARKSHAFLSRVRIVFKFSERNKIFEGVECFLTYVFPKYIKSVCHL